jgi:uncharacterized protein YggL (DUF469 family)
MRKRLRKKRHLGEFAEHAFDVWCTLETGLTEAATDAFVDRFLSQAIESQGLSCGGGGRDAKWHFCVGRAGRGSPTAMQRVAVGMWLSEQPEVASHGLGELFDAWHGRDDSWSSDERKTSEA